MVTGDKSVRRCKKICMQARHPPENFDKFNPEPAPRSENPSKTYNSATTNQNFPKQKDLSIIEQRDIVRIDVKVNTTDTCLDLLFAS